MGEASLLQSNYWARLKGTFGWRDHWFPDVVGSGEAVLVLTRSFGPFSIAYAGHAFGESVPTPEQAAARVHSVTAHFRTMRAVLGRGTVFLRWDVPWPSALFDRHAAERAGLVASPGRVQPPDTVIVDLERDPDAILAAMKPKTRYNVRLAERHGVTVRQAGVGAISRWYQLYQETAQRDRIAIHQEDYYRMVLELAGVMSAAGQPCPDVRLYLAEHETDLLAGIIVAHWNGTATYLYGAGANIKRNLMASYLLQWHAMQRARDAGCSSYDLFGIPARGDDPKDPMHGLYRFKTGFGGVMVNRPGCQDLIYRPVTARAMRVAEGARLWYHHDFRKRERRS